MIWRALPTSISKVGPRRAFRRHHRQGAHQSDRLAALHKVLHHRVHPRKSRCDARNAWPCDRRCPFQNHSQSVGNVQRPLVCFQTYRNFLVRARQHLGHPLLRILMPRLRLPPRVRPSRIPTALAMEVSTSPGVTSRHLPLIQDAASRVPGARMGEGGSAAGNQSHRLQIFALTAKGVALHMDAWMVLSQRPSWQPFESRPSAMMLPVGTP